MSSAENSPHREKPIVISPNDPTPGLPGTLSRRIFLRNVGMVSASLMLGRYSSLAEDSVVSGTNRFNYPLVPASKNFDPAWLASLTHRGNPAVYSGADLASIGMPVGGICTGQLYLGGDGRLWHWDIFNVTRYPAINYVEPIAPVSPIDQGFAVRANGEIRTLDQQGFPGVTFAGQYPIGTVTYRQEDYPLQIVLEAYSPFIPLDAENSGLPVTVMEFSVENISTSNVEAGLAGFIENPVGKFTPGATGERWNRLTTHNGALILELGARNSPVDEAEKSTREDIRFEDFEKGSYAGWHVEGAAFGERPIRMDEILPHQSPETMGIEGKAAANSHSSAPGGPEQKDAATGRLVSRDFVIEREFIYFLIGGGADLERLFMELVVDGESVRKKTGRNNNAMQRDFFHVAEFEGRTAHLEIVDNSTGPWGHISIDSIVFSDAPPPRIGVEEVPDFGTMALALLETGESDFGKVQLDSSGGAPFAELFETNSSSPQSNAQQPLPEKLVGGVGRSFTLKPGEKVKVVFLVGWHFSGLRYVSAPDDGWERIQDFSSLRRYYAKRFSNATEAVGYVAKNFEKLSATTKLWRQTWYDSTLPHWLLDRTLLNISTLATATCHRFDNGRYWFWEGSYSCNGTCTHVWSYAQAIARLFPQIERDLRERVDYGIGFVEETGQILMRAETFPPQPAVDGQAGTILRTLREHQMANSSDFLRSVWPRVKEAIEWLIALDENEDGVITGSQLHTLDQPWFGHISWISSMYVAALRAGVEMAEIVGDEAEIKRWASIADKGSQRISEDLFHKEQYFIQKVPPDKANELGSGYGCLMDQVLGQSWAFQVGLDRILPEDQTRTALDSLWLYNFTPDVGPLLKGSPIQGGRVFAVEGEAGMVICTFPDPEHSAPVGDGFHAFYFNECMSGFEYQVASHMISEGGDLVQKGLAVTRAVHDRYHPSKRNPYNEVEAGNHYGRAMSSYGVFLAACGFAYDGPAQAIGFGPKVHPENFRAAFTSAEGWGTFSQKISGVAMDAVLEVRWGEISIRTFSLEVPPSPKRSLAAALDGKVLAAGLTVTGPKTLITFENGVNVQAGQMLTISLS